MEKSNGGGWWCSIGGGGGVGVVVPLCTRLTGHHLPRDPQDKHLTPVLLA